MGVWHGAAASPRFGNSQTLEFTQMVCHGPIQRDRRSAERFLKRTLSARSARNGGNGCNGCKLQSKVGLGEDALFGGMGEVLFILGTSMIRKGLARRQGDTATSSSGWRHDEQR